MQELKIYNSLTRQKEIFKPVHEGRVGMYVCGPTVYNDVHLGNCRTFVNFDTIYRYLLFCGYKVRYVRNITDVGHLEGDVDSGAEDRMAKRARLEQLEPMEVAQKYTVGFQRMMQIFNTLPPSIEPHATGHIPEQIEMIQTILDNGLAYVKNGSVYFDTLKFANSSDEYGKLSGRIIEDLLSETRDLKNQSEKNHPSDFAIWIKAAPEHLMHWNSAWSVGFPGWHLECSAMSSKYLGKTFDIHGGGNDLKFPHHENEIAQSFGACGCRPANFWIHANMLLLNSKKMSKSDGNNIMPPELFSGNSEHISKGYSPMVVKFFMLQAHYGSPLDLTDDALQAAEKGYRRLMEASKIVQNLTAENDKPTEIDAQIQTLLQQATDDMNDDFNTPRALSRFFELASYANKLKDGHLAVKDISASALEHWKKTTADFLTQIFGLLDETQASSDNAAVTDGLMQLIIDIRQSSRANKDWATSDKIRDTLGALRIQLKDSKEGTAWMKE